MLPELFFEDSVMKNFVSLVGAVLMLGALSQAQASNDQIHEGVEFGRPISYLCTLDAEGGWAQFQVGLAVLCTRAEVARYD